MRLKLKITFGFFIIAIMLFIAGAWSVVQVKSSQSFLKTLLRKNLTKNIATMQIYEALGKNNEATILLSLNKFDEANVLFKRADSLFLSAIKELSTTEMDNKAKEIIQQINSSYSQLSGLKKSLRITPLFKEKQAFFANLYSSVSEAQKAVKKLQLFYINKIKVLNAKIGESENRSITPGLIAMSAAILFALMFSFFVNHYVVTPIVTMRKKIDDFTERGVPYEYELESEDELSELSESIRILSTRVIPKE